MRRIVVLGGTGFFGGAAAGLLRSAGLTVLVAARGPGAEVLCDAEDPASLRAALRVGDVVLDAAGPFQARAGALVEAALEIGFDVVDLADALGYVRLVYGFAERIAGRGLRYLPACSSVSAVTAAAVRLSGARVPVRVTVFLAPATRHAARRGTALSFGCGLGRPVEVWRDAQLVSAIGWGETRAFEMPPPVGRMRGGLFESADAFTLPRVWPSLREISMWADSHVFGMNAVLSVAARWRPLRWMLERPGRLALAAARLFGSAAGGIAYEVEDEGGAVSRIAFVARERAYLTAVVPAVLAVRALAENQMKARGLVRADQQVEPGELVALLQGLGVECWETRAGETGEWREFV